MATPLYARYVPPKKRKAASVLPGNSSTEPLLKSTLSVASPSPPAGQSNPKKDESRKRKRKERTEEQYDQSGQDATPEKFKGILAKFERSSRISEATKEQQKPSFTDDNAEVAPESAPEVRGKCLMLQLLKVTSVPDSTRSRAIPTTRA